jgi:hypothetical protein
MTEPVAPSEKFGCLSFLAALCFLIGLAWLTLVIVGVTTCWNVPSQACGGVGMGVVFTGVVGLPALIISIIILIVRAVPQIKKAMARHES